MATSNSTGPPQNHRHAVEENNQQVARRAQLNRWQSRAFPLPNDTPVPGLQRVNEGARSHFPVRAMPPNHHLLRRVGCVALFCCGPVLPSDCAGHDAPHQPPQRTEGARCESCSAIEGGLTRCSAFIITMRAIIGSPSCSAIRIRTSVAACHSGACCSALGNPTM
jgi:hypothetical protein